MAKFAQGKQNLNNLLGKQKCVFYKAGLGFNPTYKEKKYKNFFVKSTSSTSQNSHKNTFFNASTSIEVSPHVTCHYCMRKGHVNYKCPNRTKINVVYIAKGFFPTNLENGASKRCMEKGWVLPWLL